jgi:hypothetical protein
MNDSQREYTPSTGEAQLTFRALVAGCLAGSVVSCTNIYIGLKIGWSFGASIIAAVLSYAAFAAVGRRAFGAGDKYRPNCRRRRWWHVHRGRNAQCAPGVDPAG